MDSSTIIYISLHYHSKEIVYMAMQPWPAFTVELTLAARGLAQLNKFKIAVEIVVLVMHC